MEGLTPWFGSHDRPVRKGWYQVRNDPAYRIHHNDRYYLTGNRRYFDGKTWRGGWLKEVISIFGSSVSHQWRGLASDPNARNMEADRHEDDTDNWW